MNKNDKFQDKKGIPPLRARFLELAEQRRLAVNTRKAYLHWIREFIKYHNPRSPSDLGGEEVGAYLTFLVSKRHVSASTQHLAFNAVLFFFRYVLDKELGQLPQIPRALRRIKHNNALTRAEFSSLLAHIPTDLKLVFLVMYGCGLRITETANLKMRDVLWDEDLIVVRHTKGRSDRAVRIPKALKGDLRAHVHGRRSWQFAVLQRRFPRLSLAEVDRMLSSHWEEEFLFVGSRAYFDEKMKRICQKAISSASLQRVFKTAKIAAKISKRATPHSLRYSFATEAIAAGNNIAELQLTLGHRDANTTAKYVDVSRTIRQVTSPLDTLGISFEESSPSDSSPSREVATTVERSWLKAILRGMSRFLLRH
jgi:integrase